MTAFLNTIHYSLKSSSARLIATLAGSLDRGEVGIFPAETVYGLGCHAFRPAAIQRIFHLKGRNFYKPLALLVSDLDQAQELIADLPDAALILAKKFFPGPLTLVLKASTLGRMTMGGHRTIGVRIPHHSWLLSLIKKTGVPLATTSVNHSGQPEALSGAEAKKSFEGKVDWIVDGGRTKLGKPSTVIDLTHFPYTVRREGAIPKRAIYEALL